MSQRTLTIIRGLPGSGKSTLGERLTPGFCFSADDYFTDEDGAYQFDAANLESAHRDCLGNVESCMISCGEDLCVANTFTRFSEVEPYIDIALKNGYSVHILVCTNNYGSDHDVPEEAIQRMRDRWEDFTQTVKSHVLPEFLN